MHKQLNAGQEVFSYAGKSSYKNVYACFPANKILSINHSVKKSFQELQGFWNLGSQNRRKINKTNVLFF